MPDDLYERDALTWGETQSGLLRRLAAGERVNEQIDWANVIEEVQDVGLSELRACRSLLVQAMRHILKLGAWPNSLARSHWFEEAATFLLDARRAYTPSMRQRIDIASLYHDALAVVLLVTDDSGPRAGLPEVCPFTLDDLLGGGVEALSDAVASPPPNGNASLV